MFQDKPERFEKVKDLHESVIRLNKVDDNIHATTYGVCSEFVRKLTDSFHAAMNELPLSIHDLINSKEFIKGKLDKTIWNKVYGFILLSII